ncbi:hypothetical protein AGR56_11815 [Clostridium sp. DMHC 10]|uniref:hypothetical protein n=1 Tax=Clostridium sp. DMHC 10 TaxID=747377 RepID=UPI00069E2118|nr:hypothetical protein [Clostridium sp. DMHC 10]KOF57166.1 hypothetical protein AGR56_11815 [Clostridium sp. DMHC 10]
MISVDFEKLKELYEIVNRFQGSVSENLSRAEAQTSGIRADGDKLLRHLNEIKRFLDDEISRYQRVERKLNEKANAITFRGSKALSAVYINNISENVQVRAANINAEAFIPLALNGDAGLESKSSELKLKSENAVDKSLKAVESEIYKALSDKDLEGLKENGVDLVKIKVEEIFTFDKNGSKELSKEEEKYKNNLEEDWDNFKSNIWNEFKKDHPEVVKKLEEIKNQIEVELKTAWNNFKKDYPILAQILKVSYKTVKGIIEGGIDVGKGLVEAPFQLVHLLGQQFYDFKKDPLGTAKKWLTVGGNIYTLLNGMPPLTQEQANFRAGLVQMVRTTIDKNIIHGDAESRSRFVTNVAGNIAIFVFTDGAGASSKAGEAGEVVEEVSNGEKAEEALNTIGKTEDALNTAGKVEDAVSTAGKAENWWSKLEAPLKTFSNFNKEFSKAANTLKACINTKVEEVFTIVKETKDLGKSILYKLRDPVNEVKEIILPKRELTENQERIILEGCFTGKTLINTELGLRRIDSIKDGEKVYAEDAKTGEKELKKSIVRIQKAFKRYYNNNNRKRKTRNNSTPFVLYRRRL